MKVPRLRIVERFRLAQPRVVHVVAPAGWGKSAAAQELAALHPGAAAIDCRRFADVASLYEAFAAACAGGPPFVLLEAAEVVLALDGGEAALQAAVAAAMQAGIVAVTSRRALGLATGGAAPHEILTLRRVDLAFDDDELRAAFAPAELDDRVRDFVRDETQGWPVGVFFLERLAREGRLGEATHDHTVDAYAEWRAYIAAEVIPSYSVEERALCIACAAIPHPTADDLRLAVGYDAGSHLRGLCVPAGPVTLEGEEYRLLPIIEASIREAFADEVDAVRRRLLGLWEGAGLHLRSAELRLARGEPREAVAHLEALGPLASAQPIPRRFIAAAEAIPTRLLLQSRMPFFVLLAIPTIHARAGPLAARVAAVRANLASDDDPLLQCGALVANGALLHHLGRFLEADAALALAAAKFPDDGPAEHQQVLTAARAATAARRGRLADARDDVAAVFANERFEIDITRVELTGGYAAALPRWAVWTAEARAWLDDDVTAQFLTYPASAAWLAGDDAAYAQYAAEIEESRNRSRAASPRHRFANPVEYGRDLWSVLRFLHVALSQDDPTAARRMARVALDTVEPTGAIVWIVAAALINGALDPQHAHAHYAHAKYVAATVDVQEFHEAVAAFVDGKMDEIGVLKGLAARLRASPNVRFDAVRIDVIAGQVTKRGIPVAIRSREVEVLAALALAGGTLESDVLVDRVWPDAAPANAMAALRASVHRLRRALGDERIVVSVGGSCRLHRRVIADVLETESLVAGLRLLGTLTEDERTWLRTCLRVLAENEQAAYTRWPWFAAYEPRITELRHHVAMLLADDALQRSEPDQALLYAETLLRSDPLDEPANELLIRAHFAAGRPAEGLRRFRFYRDLLQREFGVNPPEQLLRLTTGVEAQTVHG